MTKKKIIRILIYIAFSLYVLLMLWLMFGQRLLHRITTPSIDWLGNYWHEFFDQINLMPFHTIVEFTMALIDGWDNHAIINLAGNIVMFIPLGFLLPHITRRARRKGYREVAEKAYVKKSSKSLLKSRIVL